jgi:hypothetical protein
MLFYLKCFLKLYIFLESSIILCHQERIQLLKIKLIETAKELIFYDSKLSFYYTFLNISDVVSKLKSAYLELLSVDILTKAILLVSESYLKLLLIKYKIK